MNPTPLTEAQQLRESLAEGRARLLKTIAGVSEEQFKRRPAASGGGSEPEWSIAEVLAHLLASERLFGGRMALALSEDGAPVTPVAAEERAAAARSGRVAPVPQLIHGLLAARREIERLIDAAAAAEGGLERAVTHATEGRQSIAWMVDERVIKHEAEHVTQIEAIKQGIALRA